ncbi:hypothetical protein VP1G_07112 [Cytospora mali]|uniref:Uncharacterized protein n=1 Tax=Cytospora mali TaxID=578113 RepID=A0A194V7I1_CYTMA|nr:hypothetical protein VP1G_07112 [Valsa mali var. pyri (nom. inval.)]
MAAPRIKRQFAGAASDPAQRQITAFFPTTGTVASSGSSAGSNGPSVPVRVELPAETQSNLLNVGMRVRKSVPEGYKTASYSAFNLWAEKEAATNTTAVPIPGARTQTSAAGQRELLPFCGINKVGGLSSQPEAVFENTADSLSSHAFRPGSVPSIDDVPSLTSSQESVESTTSLSLPTLSIKTSPPPTTRKRSYSEDDDSDTPSISGCLQVPRGNWMDGEVSPRSLVPLGWENTRVMAVPRKNRQNNHKAGARAVPAVAVAGVGSALALDQLGQENMVLDEDFPEADFLDYQALAGDAMEI